MRAYVLLYDGLRIYYPVKKDDQRFCPGSAQFFGGDIIEGETDEECIERELGEESNNILGLQNSPVLDWVWKTPDLIFYITCDFKVYGKNRIIGSLPGNNEMKRISTRKVTKQLTPTGLGEITSPAFTFSETAQAFKEAFKLILQYDKDDQIEEFAEEYLFRLNFKQRYN